MNLTPKQTEIIQLYANGYTSKEIEEQLGLTHSTHCTHWKYIKERLGAYTRVHAVAIAINRKIIGVI